MTDHLRMPADAPFRTMVGVGGIGGGIFLALEGEQTLGRDESRAAHLLDARDACKLHIVAHHVSVLLGADPAGGPFVVVPMGVVGDDDTGRWAVGEMRRAGIDTARVRTLPGRPSLFSVCFLYPDGAGGNITTADSASATLTEADVEGFASALVADGPRTIALAAPEVGLAPRRRLLELATEYGAFRVASFVSGELADARAEGVFALSDLVALNADEAAVLAGATLDDEDGVSFLDGVTDAIDPGHRPSMIVTAGVRGAFARHEGRSYHRAALPVTPANTAGAGDTLLAGVLAGLAAGVPLLPPLNTAASSFSCALDLGVLLSSLAVTSLDTIHPGADARELRAFATGLGITFARPLADVL